MGPDGEKLGWDMPAGASPPMEGGWSEGDDDEDEYTEADAELSRADDWYDEHGRDFRGC